VTAHRIAFDVVERTPTEWAYLAGMVDGEGTIWYHRARNTYRLFVYNTNAEVILWIGQRFGGSIGRRQVSRGYLPAYVWTATRMRDVQAILQGMLPYMIIKRNKALVALTALQARLSA
jgi:hypothetical protein